MMVARCSDRGAQGSLSATPTPLEPRPPFGRSSLVRQVHAEAECMSLNHARFPRPP